MKSKVIDLIFGDSLPYKSGLGFFVPALEVAQALKVMRQ